MALFFVLFGGFPFRFDVQKLIGMRWVALGLRHGVLGRRKPPCLICGSFISMLWLRGRK